MICSEEEWKDLIQVKYPSSEGGIAWGKYPKVLYDTRSVPVTQKWIPSESDDLLLYMPNAATWYSRVIYDRKRKGILAYGLNRAKLTENAFYDYMQYSALNGQNKNYAKCAHLFAIMLLNKYPTAVFPCPSTIPVYDRQGYNGSILLVGMTRTFDEWGNERFEPNGVVNELIMNKFLQAITTETYNDCSRIIFEINKFVNKLHLMNGGKADDYTNLNETHFANIMDVMISNVHENYHRGAITKALRDYTHDTTSHNDGRTAVNPEEIISGQTADEILNKVVSGANDNNSSANNVGNDNTEITRENAFWGYEIFDKLEDTLVEIVDRVANRIFITQEW
jgi:hypothetical protein